jgi:Ferritin-like domain
MRGRVRRSGWTRAEVLRGAAAGGAAVGGGLLFGRRQGEDDVVAAASPATDSKLLNAFLTLERVQEAFYRAALERASLSGDLAAFTKAAAGQESAHVAFLVKRLGGEAGAAPKTAFSADKFSSPERFRDAAVELEESALATYIGQAANLSRGLLGPFATMTSVEARQAAWIRDIAGVSPAPRPADPARPVDEVMADLRAKGFLA